MYDKKGAITGVEVIVEITISTIGVTYTLIVNVSYIIEEHITYV